MTRPPLPIVSAFFTVCGALFAGDPPPKDQPAARELEKPAPGARPYETKKKSPSEYIAGSRIDDKDALGGFARSSNLPKKLGDARWGKDKFVSLVAFPEEPVAYGERRGFVLRVVNRTSRTMPFHACDSALDIVCEARDAKGAWREIQSLPRSMCGNSYHRVFLGPGEYWDLPAPEFAGPFATQLRFRLGQHAAGVYSNIFDGRIHPEQFDPPKGKSK